MAIAKLPEEVRSAVRNGITIASTAQCVAELVYNSLDAAADSIIIHLDVPQYKLQVFDNGSGITFENLKSCGTRYNTSKCHSLSDIQSNLKFYGYRGEALASIIASSGNVIILTRPKSDGHTYCKTFSNGKPHQPTRSITSRTCTGTTITVQNFMYNAPVRQQRIKPNIDLEEVRMQVEGLALAHPCVSFTIQDESDNSTVLNVTRSQSTLETFSKLYGEEVTGNLYPVGPLDSGKHKMYGFISKSSHHNKKLQFVFVNGKLVKRTKVHKLINMIMRKSDVLRGNGPWQELPLPERVRDFLWVSPTKKRDRYCVFLINIDCPLIDYDITLDPEKTLIEFRDWDSLLEGTEILVKDFLKRHNLAHVASDSEICESEEESPMAVLEEVKKLEEESVRNKLDRFKHDSAKQDETKTFTARTIRSIPAKRFISNQKKSKASKNTNSPPKIVKQIGNKNKSERTHCKIQTGPVESAPENNFRSTNSQSLNEKSSNESIIDTPGDARSENPEDNTLTNVNSSLSKFRKLFHVKDPFPLKTPADQIIKVEEPPPIFKRKKPLEYRIKALMETEKNKTSDPKISVSTNTEHTNNEKSQKQFPNNFEKPADIFRNPKFLVNALSNDNMGEESGYFKKIYPTVSIATQTTSTSDSMQLRKQNNFKSYSSKKPNLKNISIRMQQHNEFEPVCDKSILQNNDRKDKNTGSVLNPQENQQCDFLTLIPLSDVNILTNTSKKIPTEEVNCNWLSSCDLICPLGEKNKSSRDEVITKFEKDKISEPRKQNKATDKILTDDISRLFSDTAKQGKGVELGDAVSNPENEYNCESAVDSSNQCTQNHPGIICHNLNDSVIDDIYQDQQPCNDSALKETDLSFENVEEEVNHFNSYEHATASNHNQEEDQMESGYTSDNIKVISQMASDEMCNSEVHKQDCLKVGQKRSSKNDEQMKCIIKKAQLEVNLDSSQCFSMDIDEFKPMEEMEIVQNIFPDDHNSQEFACSIEDVRFLKEKEIIRNEISVAEDLHHREGSGVKSNDSSVCEMNQNVAEISKMVDNDCNENSFEMFARTPFLPKGLSPILAKDSAKCVTLRKNSIHSFKLPNTENLCSLDSAEKIADDGSPAKKLPSDGSSSEINSEYDKNKTGFIASYLSGMENKKYIMECKVMSAYESSQNKSIMKIFNLMYPCTFSKSVIAKFKMIGRLDDKFIVAQINMESSAGSLVLFDQHAVHERIRLEKLMKEYVIQNQELGKTKSSCINYKSAPLVPPLEVTTTVSEIRIMEKFTENFERLGLSFKRCSGNEDKNGEVAIRITSIPACLSSKDAKELGPLGLKERIRALIREQTENLVTTRGLGTFSPEVLRDAINMEACRGAVKFGDILSDQQCRWLLKNLAKCDSPFQCAHGRPSMYPIAAISHLEKHWSSIEQEKPCLKKIIEFIKT